MRRVKGKPIAGSGLREEWLCSFCSPECLRLLSDSANSYKRLLLPLDNWQAIIAIHRCAENDFPQCRLDPRFSSIQGDILFAIDEFELAQSTINVYPN
jgi:hypothetical protein